MKKIYFAFILVLSCLSFAQAEQTSFFAGGGLNFSSSKAEITSKVTGVGSASTSNSEFGIGGLFGYKSFFSPNMGYRAYVDLNLNGGHYDYKLGANADFLYNFVSDDKAYRGVFVGANYEYVGWDGSSGSQFGLSAGARGKFFDKHGLEAGVKIPLTDHVISESAWFKTTVKENFHFFFRYVYEFQL